MKQPVFALIDCNNFFVSCERIFRPDLEGKPVVVLSSNDGCAVSRSNEAKALGIPMGAPAFKYRSLFEQHQVIKFSANFELYGNMSRRITELLATITPRIEVYSIDESFLDLSKLLITDYTAWGHAVREAILQWTGLPVSVGIAPSKTLAKLASDRGKKIPELGGVLNLVDNADSNKYLASVPIQDVWGIGWHLAPKIRATGTSNALQLAQISPRRAQQLMGIRGRQLVTELGGVSCFPLELEHQKPKSILCSRTFGEDTHDANVVESALASFATTVAFRLRRSGQLTRRAGIFIDTNKHKPSSRLSSNPHEVNQASQPPGQDALESSLPSKPGFQRWNREIIYQTPTADTGQIITDVVALFSEIYNSNASYHRAGVWVQDFTPANRLQVDVFGQIDPNKHDRSVSRMQAVDRLNERFGKGTIHYATENLAGQWQPRRKIRSPRYTTHLDELPKAKIIHTVNE